MSEPFVASPNPEATVASLLKLLRTRGGLQIEFTLRTRAAASPAAPPAAPEFPGPALASASATLEVTLSGPDTPLLLDRNGELLHAIESLAAAALRLAPEQQEQISFEAGGFKAARAAAITRLAEEGLARVRATARPYSFPPMNSLERRMLHLALAPSGLATASSGLGPRRFVVLYPEGQTPAPERSQPQQQRPRSSPDSFRNSSSDRTPPRASQKEEGADAADTHGTTDARLETIRRAFRKR